MRKVGMMGNILFLEIFTFKPLYPYMTSQVDDPPKKKKNKTTK